jgi:hypothetical protein
MTGSVLRMKLRNANPAAKITGTDELAGTSNYFVGNDPSKWRTNVPTYAKVKYEGIYSGIDLVYYGNQRQLEYDFIVAPGADPRRIAFDVSGAKGISQDSHGDLVLKVGEGEIRWHKPVAYQETNGTRHSVAVRYAITDTNRVGFEIAKYDSRRPLYVDPLIYSTYLGGSSHDDAYSIAVDSAGNAYVTGITDSTNFPTTGGAFQKICRFGCGFVSKINALGSALVYSTYLAGSNQDTGLGIAVDSSGNAFVTGVTCSTDFPTMNPLQPNYGGGGVYCGDAFVTKLNPTGSALVYSTYLGGSNQDVGFGIAVDSTGNAYVTGYTDSTNFPTKSPLQPTNAGHRDAFVTKINPSGSALVYSTNLGGSGDDFSNSIALDSSSNTYVTGGTTSTDFPTMNPLQPHYGGGQYDTFVAKINSAGSTLAYSTYLGGSGWDISSSIAVGSAGNAYITGVTNSADFPTINPLQPRTSGGYDVFVAQLNPPGSTLAYSTYLGGSGDDIGSGIAVDSAGSAYVTGYTDSTNFPTKSPLQPTNAGHNDAFVTRINPSGSALVYSTYLGGSADDQGTGIALDGTGNAYIASYTTSTDFPTMHPLQPNYGGGGDGFVAKINITPSDVTLFPLHLDFGSQPMGITSGPRVSTLTNAGGDTLTIKSISVIGTNSGDFAQTNNCGTSVPVGTSCSITATFTPLAAGNRSAVVSITDSAPDSPQTVDLTGIGLLDTATKLTSSANPSALGESVTFKATVSSPQGGTPTGDVSFLDGATTLANTGLRGGTATFATRNLPLGLNIITASYGGDSNYGRSTSAPINQYVLEAATTTTLSSSPNPSIYGQAVTFTATVTSRLGAPPDGETVMFKKGTTVLGTGTLSGGSASFTTATLKVGRSLVNAVYGGDSNFVGSTSKAVSQVVSKATTTTTLASSQNPSNVGQPVTFTATVTPQFAGKVTGTVTFYDGTTALKTVALSGGVAKFTTSTLTSGAHNITATYNGSASFIGSSASLTQRVN